MGNISSEQLWILRNKIEITHLIQRLNIPNKHSEGFFRFLCPICNEFNTAANPKTNLARCFICSKNFNTIELVMLVQAYPFRRAVQFLQSL